MSGMPATAAAPTAAWPDGPLRVVVLTCGDPGAASGFESARAIAQVPGVAVVAVAVAPHRRPRGIRARLRQVYRRRGLPGLVAIPARKLGAMLRPSGARSSSGPGNSAAGVTELALHDFHADESLAALRALSPDLAVIDGTYILKESVFTLPRLGAINLHCGKLPEYRGAPPAFWELYNGEHEVGVTVHWVTAGVDEGPILRQELVPLDPAPAGDPMRVVHEIWRDTLRPIGVRLLAEAVAAIAAGKGEGRRQDPSAGRTYRFPDYRTVRELRARVADRRRTAAR